MQPSYSKQIRLNKAKNDFSLSLRAAFVIHVFCLIGFSSRLAAKLMSCINKPQTAAKISSKDQLTLAKPLFYLALCLNN
jgi:hypothetical protein